MMVQPWLPILLATIIDAAPASKSAENPPVRAASDFSNSVGINIHLGHRGTGYFDQFPLIQQRLTELGVKHVRDNMVSHTFLYRDGGPIPKRWAALAEKGISVTLIANFARPASDAVLAAQMAPGAIEAIEGPNEVDLGKHAGWPERLRKFQLELYSAAKAAQPSFYVLAPSMGRPEHARELGNVAAFADAANLHSYPGGLPPFHNLSNFLRAGELIAPGRPVVATETGYHRAVRTRNGHLPASEAAVSKYLPRLLLDYHSLGIKRTFIYQLYDESNDPTLDDREAHFGLVDHAFNPKPSFHSVANLLAIMHDPGSPNRITPLSYALSGDLGGVRQAVYQKRNGHYYLCLWLDSVTFDNRTRADLQSPSRTVRIRFAYLQKQFAIYRPRISRKPERILPGGRELSPTLTDEVIVLEIEP